MDDTWKAYLSSFLLTVALLSSLTGHAADLEFISHEQTEKLATDFNKAAEATDALLTAKKEWSCDMYGMRTRLQVQKGVKLYNWSHASESWMNSGASPVAEYRLEKGVLKGKSERVEDQVRLTPDGKLISRLSTHGESPRVLAYSICTAQ